MRLVCPCGALLGSSTPEACASCGVEIPHREGVPDFVAFDDHEPALRARAQDFWRAHQGEDRWRAQREHAWERLLVLLTSRRPPPGVAVDVGAGRGRLARRVAGMGYEACAVDVVPVVEPGPYDRLLAPMEALPVPDEGANAVLMSSVLQHARDPAAALDEAARSLAPGGLLVLALTPLHADAEDARRAARVMRDRLRAEGARGPLVDEYRHFLQDELVEGLTRRGLTVEVHDPGLGPLFKAKRWIKETLTGHELASFPIVTAQRVKEGSDA